MCFGTDAVKCGEVLKVMLTTVSNGRMDVRMALIPAANFEAAAKLLLTAGEQISVVCPGASQDPAATPEKAVTC